MRPASRSRRDSPRTSSARGACERFSSIGILVAEAAREIALGLLALRRSRPLVRAALAEQGGARHRIARFETCRRLACALHGVGVTDLRVLATGCRTPGGHGSTHGTRCFVSLPAIAARAAPRTIARLSSRCKRRRAVIPSSTGPSYVFCIDPLRKPSKR